METADWSIAIGVLVYTLALVVAVLYYATFRKLSLVLYVASVSTLIFSICYMIDVFDFSRHLIMITLTLSTVIFFALGKYFKGITYTSKSHLGLEQAEDKKEEELENEIKTKKRSQVERKKRN